MGVFQNNLMGAAAAAASAGGAGFYTHQIANSVKMVAPSSTSSSNARLTRTVGTVDSNVHWTLNFWIKRSAIEGKNPVSSARPLDVFTPRSGTSGSVLHEFQFGASGSYGAGDAFAITNTNTGAYILSTNNLFRDTSAWYNIHIQADLDNGTAGEKLKIFINGTEASYNVDNRSSYTSLAGMVAGAWTIGDYYGYGYPIQSYFAQWCYIDGTTVAASEFGETKNGVWIPKDPSGLTFGSEGFLLNFESSSDLGNDSSGNNNDWTSSNLATHDQMLDSPTFGSEGSANFCTMNPLSTTTQSSVTAKEGNLFLDGSTLSPSSYEGGQLANMGVRSGKWYWEVYLSGGGSTTTDRGWSIGIASTGNLGEISGTYGPRCGADSNGYAFSNYSSLGIYHDGSITSYGSAPADTNIIGMALDLSSPGSGSLTIYINDSSEGVAVDGSIADAHWVPYIGLQGGNVSSYDATANFGQDSTFAGAKTAGGNADSNGYGDFFYAPPSGHLALCAGNLPTAEEVDPAQTDDNYPSKLFSPLIWTGDGNTSRAITGLGFQPDWLWFKSRSSAFSHRLYDTSRGIGSTGGKRLFSNTDGAETDQTSGQDISAVGSDGFTLGASSNLYTNDTNSGGLQAGWFWRANGGTTSSDASGDITSVGQADPSGCFSIVTYTGSGTANNTVAHHLSQAPSVAIFKRRGGTKDWMVTAGTSYMNTRYLQLNDTDAATTGLYNSGRTFSSSAGASLMTLEGATEQNGSGYSMVAYFFSNCEGYIKIGEYEGNGNADGSFVYTGLRPAWIMLKRTDSTGNWHVFNNKVPGYNTITSMLWANTSDDEDTASSNAVDFLSNGFKIRTAAAEMNTSSGVFIYLAFAKNPFQYATAR